MVPIRQAESSEADQTLSVASHNFNAGLRQIRCYSQLIREQGGSLKPETLQSLTQIEQSAENLQALVTGFFSLLRLRAADLHPTEIDLTVLLQRLAVEMHEKFRASGAVFTFDRIPRTVADREILTKVMQHLVDNGIKFNRSTPPRVHVSGRRQGKRVVVAVQDNGIGISQEYLERCFMSFGRLHSEREYSGQGLGLAFCKKAITLQKGRIWIESSPGQGSTVRFSLPSAD